MLLLLELLLQALQTPLQFAELLAKLAQGGHAPGDHPAPRVKVWPVGARARLHLELSLIPVTRHDQGEPLVVRPRARDPSQLARLTDPLVPRGQDHVPGAQPRRSSRTLWLDPRDEDTVLTGHLQELAELRREPLELDPDTRFQQEAPPVSEMVPAEGCPSQVQSSACTPPAARTSAVTSASERAVRYMSPPCVKFSSR